MFFINVPDKNDSVGRVSLSGRDYYIRFTYNTSYDYWSFGLYSTNMDPILPMTKVTVFNPLLHYYTYTELPDGLFGCFSMNENVGRKAFVNNKAWFCYIPNSELEGFNPYGELE